MLDQSISEAILYLVSKKMKFAIYSLPNSNDISLVVSQGINNKECFVIQDFDSTNKEYIIEKDIFLQNEDISVSKIESFGDLILSDNVLNRKIHILNKTEYKNYVSNVVDKCKNGILIKGVPARIISKEKPTDFNLGNYFLKLVKQYQTAFVNLYYHNECGLWIGATPELLVKETQKNIFETFSLAGTKLKTKNRNWTSKEIEEQKVVTDYIVKVLKTEKCIIENISEVKTIDAGLIQHLKTTIQFSSLNNINIIAKILHPTPAVCGIPLDKSFELIKKVEGNQRQNYTGFFGLNFNKNKQLFVNLRCMQVLENSFYVYVGAGVIKNSDPEKEWIETENKAQTLLSLL